MNTYIQPDTRATRLTRLTREQVESANSLAAPIRCTFVVPLKVQRKGKAPAKKAKTRVVEISDGEAGAEGEGGEDEDREEQDTEEGVSKSSSRRKSAGNSSTSKSAASRSAPLSKKPSKSESTASSKSASKRARATAAELSEDEFGIDGGNGDISGISDVEDYPVYGKESQSQEEARVDGFAFKDAYSDDEEDY